MLLLIIFILFLIPKQAFAIANNYGALISSEMNPDTNIYISNSYVSKMTIRVVGSEIYFSFSDGNYRRISLETSNVKDVSRLLRSDGYLEDGQLDRG
ncbi:hypothetical protein TUM4445_16780 [Shewanella sp. MBTL60-112-B2]|nr:hypothetical protein TUM4444_18830 [Shewanella sp. MBTL60-112-B1]GIU31827.1 hypothetical protein TUM4445_16780 [Shewanella sp. MBTL60-112-B2]